MNNDVPQHIDELVSAFKKQLNSYSKVYSKLSQFIYQTKAVQNDTIDYIYENNSQLEGLLREIQEQEINGDTFRKIAEFQHQHSHVQQQGQQPSCTCHYCNNKNRDEDDEEQYYEEDEEEDGDDS